MTEKALALLSDRFLLTQIPAGEFAALKIRGMRFTVRAYEAKGLGHVSVLQAKGFFGWMHMDTLIVDPLEKDLPLFSCDRVHAFGRELLLGELYDTLLTPRPFDSIAAVRAAFSDLKDSDRGTHWYDSIRLPESFAKTGKKADVPRLEQLEERFLAAYLAATPEEPCDPAAKKAKAAVYVDGLLENGGPSTDVFLKSLGREKTEALFRRALFGTGI